MATVARFTAPLEAFPFESLFDALPEATLELERIVPTDGAVIPYLWVRNAPVDDVVSAVDEHPSVTSLTLVDRIDDEQLLRCEWAPENRGILDVIVESGVALLSATGTRSGWTLEVRGDDRDAVATFQRQCLDHGYSVVVRGLHPLSADHGNDQYELTDPQREALVLAYERGYFEEPRRVTMADLASELGISRQAFASRLRRGHHQLVGNTLTAK